MEKLRRKTSQTKRKVGAKLAKFRGRLDKGMETGSNGMHQESDENHTLDGYLYLSRIAMMKKTKGVTVCLQYFALKTLRKATKTVKL